MRKKPRQIEAHLRLAYQQTLQHLLGAQREALLRMRSEGRLSNEVMNRILRELDLEESRLEI